MKKSLAAFLITFAFIMFSTNAFPYNKTIDGKIGTGYADDPDKFGWQLNFAYLADLDPFFALGFEPGIYWAHWDRKVGEKNVGTTLEADVKADTNAYIIPLMADAQIRLPNLERTLHAVPYITLGLGYSLMILDYSIPSYTDTDGHHSSKDETKLFGGLTWQLTAGASFDPGSSSKIKFLAEVGYRGAKLKNDDLEVDMSGFVINVGIRYPLGSSAPAESVSIQ